MIKSFNMRQIFFFFLCIAFVPLQAQQYISSVPLNNKWKRIIYQEQNDSIINFIAINKKKTGLIVTDTNLIIKHQSVFPLSYKKHQLSYVSSFILGGQRMLFASFWNKKKKKNFLFVRHVNRLGDSIGGWHFLCGSNQYIEPEEKTFFIKRSNDGTKYAVYYKKFNLVDSGPIKVDIWVFDKDNAVIYQRNYLYIERSFQKFVEQLEISNSGDVYLKVVINYGINRANSVYVYRKKFRLIHFNRTTQSPRLIKLSLEDKYITDAVISSKSDGGLWIAGYFSNVGYASMDGSYIFSFDNNGLELRNKYVFSKSLRKRYAFDLSFFKQVSGEMYKFRAQRIEEDAQGRVYLLGELIKGLNQFKREHFSGSLYDSDKEGSVFEYGDILIVNLLGANHWEQLIAKKQKGLYSPYLSYSYSFNPKGFLFAFNVNKYNSYYLGGRGQTAIVKLAINGNWKWRKVFNVTSCANPLLYRPMPFNNAIYLLGVKNILLKFQE